MWLWPVVVLLVSVLVAGIAAAKSSLAGIGSGSGTFVKAYSNVVSSTRFDLTPQDVQATGDGGYVALADTASASPTRPSVSWLVKLSGSGGARWQRELGCLGNPPRDYALGSAIVPTADGGYVVGGGTIGCGSGNNCAAFSGVQCALVEKVSAAGAVVWARVYNAGATGSGIDKIRPTRDGGFIAVGTINDANQNIGGLILKLNGRGAVRWQRQLGPAGSTDVLLHDVRQTSDDGYVLTGYIENPRAPDASASVLVVRLDASGNVVWQRSFKGPSGPGESTAVTAYSIVQSADGGFLVSGYWDNAPAPMTCCSGALLLKLDAAGNIRWQNALSGGLYCFFNGFNETCANLAGFVYSLQRTADGGYVLSGDET